MKELQTAEICLERDKKSQSLVYTNVSSGMDIFDEKTYEVKIVKLKTEIDYLNKVKKYRWLFGK